MGGGGGVGGRGGCLPVSPCPQTSAWWRRGPSPTCPPGPGSPGSAPSAAFFCTFKGTESRTSLAGKITHCRGISTTIVQFVILLWRGFIHVKILERNVKINPPVVFTFTCQRWSSNAFSSLLAFDVWVSNTHLHLSAPIFFLAATT